MRKNDYKKRLVKWDWIEDGWVFSKNAEYTICPSIREGMRKYSELWSRDKLISTRADIDLLKNDADKFEMSRSKLYG